MERLGMAVDSFRFLPRIIAYYYQKTARRSDDSIPWSPLPKTISKCRFGLITSGGIFNQLYDRPFDVERERREPTWGDPTYREIGINIREKDIGVSHLHINTRDILSDINILLPIQRFKELVKYHIIGSLNPTAYSFMGYQGFPPNSTEWARRYGPEVANAFLAGGVDCVFLTPA
jgi:hypothetical protein